MQHLAPGIVSGGQRVSRLIVELPSDRSRSGCVELFDDNEDSLCGPFVIAGLASSALAARHGNPARNPILPYGDTPTGNYRVRGRVRSGSGTPLPKREYGPHGILVLEGLTGDAALADANGRFSFAIHGGELTGDGWLCSTAGSLRMRDVDLKVLISVVERLHVRACEVIEFEGAGDQPVVDGACAASDPAPVGLASSQSALKSSSVPRPATAILAMGATFAFQGAVAAAPARANVANRPRIPATRVVQWIPAAASGIAANHQAYNPPPTTSSASSSESPAEAALVRAQDTALSNPDFGAGVGGATHCNQATCEVAKDMGAPMTPFLDASGNPLLANQIVANLAKPDSGYRPVTEQEARALADRGKLVIVAGPGHVATIRPDNLPGQSRPPGSGPIIANVGSTNGVLSLSQVFRSSQRNQVQYYTPKN